MNFWIDNTRLKDFMKCERSYYFRHVMGIVPEKGKLVALEVGSLMHKAWEVWLGFTQTQDGPTPLNAPDNLGLHNALEVIRKHEHNYTDWFPYKSEYDKSNLVNVFSAWAKAMPLHQMGIIDSVERPIRQQLLPGIDFVALIDLVLSNNIKEKTPIDHKTMTKLGDKEQHSPQLMGYCWILGTNTALVNAGEISVLPVGRRVCKTHGGANSLCSQKHFKNALYPVTFDQVILKRWKQTAQWAALRMRKIHEQKFELALPNVFSCSSCRYKQACEGDMTGYVEEVWDPTKGGI